MGVDLDQGLAAAAVQRRLAEYGPNETIGGVSASEEVSINTSQSQEQQKHAKDTHYYYIHHALIVY